MRPLPDGGFAVVEDNTASRGTPGASGHAAGRPADAPPDLPSPAQALIAAQALMADELPDGLVVANDVGRVIVFNRAAARLTSIAAE
jgi:PAS domain-containing protein